MAADPHNTGGPPGGFWRRMRVDTRPLRHRDFRNLWIGQAVSTIGGAIGLVAVPYQVSSTALACVSDGVPSSSAAASRRRSPPDSSTTTPVNLARSPHEVAPELIGAELYVDGVGGIIVEVEAYDHEDPACARLRQPADGAQRLDVPRRAASRTSTAPTASTGA